MAWPSFVFKSLGLRPAKPLGIRRNHFGRLRSQPETHYPVRSWPLVKREGSIVWALISSIYRAYCYARLLEMRRNHYQANHA